MMTRYELLLTYIASNNSSNNIPGTVPTYKSSNYRGRTLQVVQKPADILQQLGLDSLDLQQAERLLEAEVKGALTITQQLLVCDSDNAIVHEGLLCDLDLVSPTYRNNYKWYASVPSLFSTNKKSTYVQISPNDLEVLSYALAS
jgi:hypothetical protein